MFPAADSWRCVFLLRISRTGCGVLFLHLCLASLPRECVAASLMLGESASEAGFLTFLERIF
jgi:hypothetical protein